MGTFIGYLVCELKCLGAISFVVRPGLLAIEEKERNLRKCLAYTILAFTLGFGAIQFVLIFLKDQVCCADLWLVDGDNATLENGVRSTIHGKPVLADSATGVYMKLKVISFICEDIAVISMVISHLVIWYF